nr:MAG TPA: hypothetical protein [Caudoviricetes sp.]DAU00934.1 MAG TPA: hypothetical protein [Caudoviricetes sp.]
MGQVLHLGQVVILLQLLSQWILMRKFEGN